MAKRMQDKESIAGVSWLIVLALSCWGGLVRYLIDVKQNKATGAGLTLSLKLRYPGLQGLSAGWLAWKADLAFT